MSEWRTRVERKIHKMMTMKRKEDKMMPQKRKMMEIEAKLKMPVGSEPQLDDKENAISGPSSHKRAKRQTKPMVTMSKKMETQSLLQRNVEFVNIGSGRPSLKADSAGHKLDTNHYMRVDQRLLLSAALTETDIPSGSHNPMSIATRLESAIWRVLRFDHKDYLQYCNVVASYIRSKKHTPTRHGLLLGWTEPEDFVFVPSIGTELRARILRRIRTRESEDKEKIKVLERNKSK